MIEALNVTRLARALALVGPVDVEDSMVGWNAYAVDIACAYGSTDTDDGISAIEEGYARTVLGDDLRPERRDLRRPPLGHAMYRGAYNGPDRRVKDDPHVPQWEERRGR